MLAKANVCTFMAKKKKNRYKLTKDEANIYLEDFLDRYANDERILQMQRFPHHPPISAYIHSIRVVRKCVDLVNFYHMKVDWENLLLAALLHDFYLYDFREHTSFKNGIIHPIKAAENAKAVFNADDSVARAIRTHMFPAVFWRIPTSREAWIISTADKMVAMKEVFQKK